VLKNQSSHLVVAILEKKRPLKVQLDKFLKSFALIGQSF
jgi:hypothetical protein